MQDDPPDVTRIPDALPVLPLDDAVLYPGMVTAVVVGQPPSLELVTDAMRANKLVAVVARKAAGEAPAGPDDLYGVGTAAIVHELGRADETARVAAMGIARIRTIDFTQRHPYLVARVEVASELEEETLELEALMGTAKRLFTTFVQLTTELSSDVGTAATKVTDAHQLAYLIASTVPLRLAVRQEILELNAPSSRLRRLVHALQHEISVRQLMHRITTETAEEMTKAQREHILRKHMEAIQRELGELPGQGDAATLRERLANLPLSDEARTEATRELERLERTPELSPEHGMIRTYLDWILKLPWGKAQGARIDIARAREVLDEDHFDLDKVKDRIIDYLAVKHLREERTIERGPAPSAPGGAPGPHAIRTEPILCFVGPPGVGKTSLGQSIARALGRTFVHQSLGGVHDEAEIRGHRRTYIGALPGRIIQEIFRCGSNNPVFMLDEVDKIGLDFRGDPASALLEVLDPEQNSTFTDHYLDVPFDLSNVMFITTANLLDPVPAALKDRMEVIRLSGYTDEEKEKIAVRYLIPKEVEENGLSATPPAFASAAIYKIIGDYTREAGVRNLQRSIASVCRKVAKEITQGKPLRETITPEVVEEFLGPRTFFNEVAAEQDRVGVVTGLAWTETGGDILFVEATRMKGKRDLILTGSLGDVMKESARTALSYVRATCADWGIDEGAFEDTDLHIHVPAGAIPKDGPSAGLTMVTAIVSLLSGRPARRDVAMTGEISLTGRALAIGGLKEKVLAARRAGVKTVVAPSRNRENLEDIPDDVKNELTFIFVDDVHEAVAAALQ